MRAAAFDRTSWRAELPRWCERWLGVAPRRELFEAGWTSAVVGLELADGQLVVVKVRPVAARLEGCHRVQAELHARGFPCPQPLVGPRPLGNFAASAERYLPDGKELAPLSDRPRRFAELLARLVALAPALDSLPSLEPAPPWARWEHDGVGNWPRPVHDEIDMNSGSEPEWLFRLAVRVRERLAASSLEAVVGHVDWESQNLRWVEGAPAAVHDWDSVSARPEACVAGLAAAVFPASGPVNSASLAESDAFLEAYEKARGRPFTGEEREAAWAAGLWVLAYNARTQMITGRVGAGTPRLIEEQDERLRLAGA